jgi:hypothetical protein
MKLDTKNTFGSLDVRLVLDVLSGKVSRDYEYDIKLGEDFETVEGLIDGIAGGRVTQAGKVLLSELAEAGTEYHEAFHYVSQFLINNTEREELYNEWKKIKFSFPTKPVVQGRQVISILNSIIHNDNTNNFGTHRSPRGLKVKY